MNHHECATTEWKMHASITATISVEDIVSSSLETVSSRIKSLLKRFAEMAYQLELRYGKLANDEELAIMGAPGGTRQTQVTGPKGTAREMASLHNQWDASVVVDSTGNTTVADQEADILSAHLASYTAGGNPTYLLTPPNLALHIGNFAYSSGRQRDIRNERQLVNVIDLYASYYGELDVVLDRNQDQCYMGIDFNYTATPVLRPTRDWPLARTGDADNRQILRESTFALLNTKSGFLVDNVPASLTV